jgi:hypothetical protein
MHSTETGRLIDNLIKAKSPEDVFGTGDVTDLFRKWVKMLHPDLHPGDKSAETGFKILNEFKEQADNKVKNGTYGNRSAISKPVVIKTKNGTYTVTDLVAKGDVCQVYSTNDAPPYVLKIPRSPANADLMNNEAQKLNHLWKDSPVKDKPIMRYVPCIKDSFTLKQGSVHKPVTVLNRVLDSNSLVDVHAAYPALPLADAAWMFNRMLGAIMVAHYSGLVHGAVLPPHFLIHAPTHGGTLLDWKYAVKKGEKIKAIVPAYKDFYPLDVFDKMPATYGVDLYMAASTLLWLLGGNVKTKTFPTSTPNSVRGLLRACWLSGKHRTSDVDELYDDFKNLLEHFFGKPKFRPFLMPGAPSA